MKLIPILIFLIGLSLMVKAHTLVQEFRRLNSAAWGEMPSSLD